MRLTVKQQGTLWWGPTPHPCPHSGRLATCLLQEQVSSAWAWNSSASPFASADAPGFLQLALQGGEARVTPARPGPQAGYHTCPPA